MATSHGATVVKNLCYSAPRKPKTKLPATENERTIPVSNDDDEGHSEKHSSRREKGIKIHTPKSMRDSLKELQTLDEQDFYKHLLALKKEHKRTLKTVEKMYYSEMQKQRSGFDIDHETRITVEDDSLVKRAARTAIPDDYNPYDTGYEELLQSDLLPATDLVRDMSVKENQEPKYHQDHHIDARESLRRSHSDVSDDSWSEDEVKVPARKRTQSSEQRVLYKEMLPNRSSALDTVESYWKDFSVYDYPHESSSPPKPTKKEDTWSPCITIPKPFSMTIREANKSKERKTRSQRLLEEELKMKKEREEAELQKKFRSQPIPATTFLPLYDEINRQNEVRRQYVRETSKALLKSSEKPFSFTKREEQKQALQRSKSLNSLSDLTPQKENKGFKANPFPAHLFDLTLADKLAEQDEYRAIKIKLRSQETLAQSRLPMNMEGKGRHYTVGKLRNKKMKEKEKKAFMTKDHTFKPQINHDIPDFDVLQYQFDKELREKKREREPTVVEPFNLRTASLSDARSRSRSLTKRSTEGLRSSLGRSGGRPASARSLSRERPSSARASSRERPMSASLSYSSDTLPFGTTESTRLRETKIRQSLDEKKMKVQESEKELRRKQKRLKDLRPQVTRKAMANDNSWQLRRTADVKIKSFREADKARKEEYLRELEEMQSRVDKRPLLFERQSQLNAKRSAERKYEDILRSAGVDEQLVRSLVTTDGKIIDAETDEDDVQDDSDVDDIIGTAYSTKMPADENHNDDDDDSDIDADT